MSEVILGLPGPWAEDPREKANHYTTKIGGLPDWPTADLGISPNLLKCCVCGERLCLLAQVYAPISSSKLAIEERVIYVLGWQMPKCGRDPRSWRVLRVQKCHQEVQPDSPNCKAEALGEDPAPTPRIRSWLDSEFLLNGSGEHDDESGGDEDLEELSQAFAEAAAVASHSRSSSSSRQSKAVAKGLVTEPRQSDGTVPAMPCFYTYCQEIASGGVDAVYTSYSSLSIKEGLAYSSDHEDEENWEGETYEHDKALGADRTYLKFKKQLDAYPEQCFRYSYGGKPLLPTKRFVKSDTCKLCGSLRHYEMQLMPPILYFLRQAADRSITCSPEGWSWMTLIVFTCSQDLRVGNLLSICIVISSKNCCPSQCKEKPCSCCWVVAEETLMLEDE